MKRILLIFLLLLPLFSSAVEPLEALVGRLVPQYQNRFSFELDESASVDFFQLESKGDKIHISGNRMVSLATGLNWYLRYYCHVSVSQCGDQLQMPKKLPKLQHPVRKETDLTHSFYLNYCTFSYTMAFWGWEEWEKEIDRMALNGVTTPMAMVGVECVWRNFLKRYDYSEKEIEKFIPGPAYQGWFLMGNLEEMGGPLPLEWYDRQEKLQKKILARMKEYGMTPVYQAFFGMVPSSLREKYFEADIIDQGKWLNFNRPPILNPTDPLFEEMAQVWYEEYEKLFGKATYYAGDLFHEGGKKDNVDVVEACRSVQDALLESVPNSTWVVQSWGGNPTNELLEGVDKEHVLIVDLCAEYWDRWRTRESFSHTPWIWANITNWGGNVGLHGRLDAIANEPIAAQKEAKDYIKGIGNVPEGIETNPIVLDLMNEMRWHHDSLDLGQWVKNYTIYRYGKESDAITKAWDIIRNTAYGTYKGHRRPSESVFCARPSMKVKSASAWGGMKIYYDTKAYREGVENFLLAYNDFKDVPTYEYDLVDFTRQYVANTGREIYYDIQRQYKAKNVDSLRVLSSQFLDLVLIQDSLLSYKAEFDVDRWLSQARACSDNPEYQQRYEYNAKSLITTWAAVNSPLVDYAHREWSGLLKEYYYPRWKSYFTYLLTSLEKDETSPPDFHQMEVDWVKNETPLGKVSDKKNLKTYITTIIKQLRAME